MTKVADYTAAGYLQPSPYGDDEVLFVIPIRIRKDTVEAGGFELAAGEYGWTPESGIPAPQACINEIKQFSNRTFAAALERVNQENARQLTAAQIATMV